MESERIGMVQVAGKATTVTKVNHSFSILKGNLEGVASMFILFFPHDFLETQAS